MEECLCRNDPERFYDLFVKATDDAEREWTKRLIDEESVKEDHPNSAQPINEN